MKIGTKEKKEIKLKITEERIKILLPITKSNNIIYN